MTSCSHYLGANDNLYRLHNFSCRTGQNIGSLLANGDIYVCPNVSRISGLIQGNIKTDSFPDVWKHKFEWFRRDNRQKNEKCGKCEYYRECKGDSLHSWNFSVRKPDVCFQNHTFVKTKRDETAEKQIKTY